MTGDSHSDFGRSGHPTDAADSAYEESEATVSDANGQDQRGEDDATDAARQRIGAGRPSQRAFRAWTAARDVRESGPSIWARATGAIAGLFGRRGRDESDAAIEGESEDFAARSRDVPDFQMVDPLAGTGLDLDAIEALGGQPHIDSADAVSNDYFGGASSISPSEPDEPVAPPRGFRFPWTRAAAAAPPPPPPPHEAPASDERRYAEPSEPAEPERAEPELEKPQVTEPEARHDDVPRSPMSRPSIEASGITRVGGRYELEFEDLDEDVSLVEEPTPELGGEPPVEATFTAEEPPPVAPKRGVLARLFGRRSKESQQAPVEEPPAQEEFTAEPPFEAPVAESVTDQATAEQIESLEPPPVARREAPVIEQWLSAGPTQPVADALPAAQSEDGPTDARYDAVLRALRSSMSVPVAEPDAAASDVVAHDADQTETAEIGEATGEFDVADVPARPSFEPADQTEFLPEGAAPVEETEFLPEVPPEEEPPKRGLFARLFGRRTKKVEEPPVEEAAIEEPPIDEQLVEEQPVDAEFVEEASALSVDQPLGEIEEPEYPAVAEFAPPQVEPVYPEVEEPPVDSADPFTGASSQRFAEPFAEQFAEAPAEELMDAPIDAVEVPAAEATEVSRFDRPTVETPEVDETTGEFEPVPPPAPAPAELEGGTTDEFEPVPAPEPAELEGGTTDEFEPVPPPEAAELEGGTTGEMAPPPGFLARLFGRGKTGETTLGTTQPGQTLDETEPSFMVAKYRAFYTEIIRAQQQKQALTAGFATAILSDTAADATTPESAAQELGWHLQQILELQTAEANWMREGAARYPEAQYAMVALADEMFSIVEWPGQSAWPRHGLEAKLFHSFHAHIEFFNRVDALLRGPAPDRAARDLARVYLFVLASGFQGMYREPGLTRPLTEYRQRLYEFVHGKFALDIYEPTRALMPDTVAHTLVGRAVGRFTSAQRWTAVLIVLLATYFAISHSGWTRLSADLKDVTSRVQSVDAAPPPAPTAATAQPPATPGGK